MSWAMPDSTYPGGRGAYLAAFTHNLAHRSDVGRCRCALAKAFIRHRREMHLDASFSEAFVIENVDRLLGLISVLFGMAEENPEAGEWLDRMAWLPSLVADLDAGKAGQRLDS